MDISTEHCNEILKNYINSSNFTLLTFKLLPFDNPLAGLIGEHFILEIQFKIENKKYKHSFFVKTMSTNKVMFELTKSIDVYEKEKFFYTELKTEYERMNLDTSFIPNGYLFFPYVVVLENVSLSGFKGTNKKQSLDLDHCKICLDILAKFHANSLIYERLKSKELGVDFKLIEKYPNELENKVMNPENQRTKQYFESSIKGLVAMINEIVTDVDVKQRFIDAIHEYLESLVGSDDGNISPLTVLHGDLWSSNFLYIYEDGKPVKGKLVDFQTLNYGLPHTDLLQFLMTSTRKSIRDQHYTNLLDFYYNTINKYLEIGGYGDILQSKDIFLEICENCKIAAKIFAIIDRCITFISDDNFAEAAKSEQTFQKFLFDERSDYIIASYRKDNEFQELMKEDILELKQFLIK